MMTAIQRTWFIPRLMGAVISIKIFFYWSSHPMENINHQNFLIACLQCKPAVNLCKNPAGGFPVAFKSQKR